MGDAFTILSNNTLLLPLGGLAANVTDSWVAFVEEELILKIIIAAEEVKWASRQ